MILNKIYKEFLAEIKPQIGLGRTFTEEDVEFCAMKVIETGKSLEEITNDFVQGQDQRVYKIVKDFCNEKKNLYLDKYNDNIITKDEFNEYMDALVKIDNELIRRNKK